MEKRFTILDAITDTTLYGKHYEAFRQEHDFHGLQSIQESLHMPLQDNIFFGRKGDLIYIVRHNGKMANEWTGAIIRQEAEIPVTQYPVILAEKVDPWILEHKRYF